GTRAQRSGQAARAPPPPGTAAKGARRTRSTPPGGEGPAPPGPPGRARRAAPTRGQRRAGRAARAPHGGGDGDTTAVRRARAQCGAPVAADPTRNDEDEPNSPPAEKPCTSRASSSTSGATRPIAPYVGVIAMTNAAPAIRLIVSISPFLRPCRSAYAPSTAPP